MQDAPEIEHCLSEGVNLRETKTMSEWRPISEADKTIVDVMDFPEHGISLRNSATILARDEDGRTYEACWTDHKGGYWWDFDSESPVNPVEFQPLPDLGEES